MILTAIAMLIALDGSEPVGANWECTIPEGVASVKSRSELPEALRDRFKGISMPGEASNAFQERSGFIWHLGTRWVALLGHDHDFMSLSVVAFDVGADGLAAREIPIVNDADPPADLCQLSRIYLKR